MSRLNDYTPATKKNIHLLVTSLCERNCPFCCNKQYDLSNVPQATEKELARAENIFITGGEPFAFARPNEIAGILKLRYLNLHKVIVYTNAYELYRYLYNGGSLCHIDGLTISIKDWTDVDCWNNICKYMRHYPQCKENWLYYFDDEFIENLDTTNFVVKKRVWQKDFTPAPDSIFRRI